MCRHSTGAALTQWPFSCLNDSLVNDNTRQSTGFKISEKGAKERKPLKDFQEPWRATVQDHVTELQESLTPWKQNIKK